MAAVSVVIPLYNAQATIAQTLASLTAQTLHDWEAVVVDDGSTDRGPEMVASLSRADARIRLVTQANAGPAVARNRAMALARGSFLHFLDADDWLMPRGLEQLVAAVQETGAAYGAYEVRGADGGFLHEGPPSGPDLLEPSDFLRGNPLAPHAHLVRREAYRGLEFDTSMRQAEDYDLWVRLAARGVRWRAVRSTVSAYRSRPASLSKDFSAMLRSVQTVIGRAHAGCAPARPALLDAAMGRAALDIATMIAITGPGPLVDRAAAAFAGARGSKGITPAAGAGAAYWGMVFGACVPPVAEDPRARRLWPAIDAWWRRCEEEGWADAGLVTAGRNELARLMVTPAAVADALLDAAGTARRLVIVGLGHNGRRVLLRALERGLNVSVRDDRFGSGLGAPGLPAAAAVEPMDAPLAPGDAVLVTPLNDGPLVSRMRGPYPVIRWSVALDGLSHSVREQLGRAWPTVEPAAP